MKLLRILALLLVANLSSAEARVLRGSAPAVGPNSALSGIVGFDSTMFPFVNFLKEAVSAPSQIGTTFIYPNNLLQGSNLPNGSISTRMGFSTPLPSTVYSGHYVFAMQGTVGGNGILFASNGGSNQPGTVYSKTGGTTLSGCTNANVPPCTFTALNITGTNPQIEFDNSPVVSSLLLNWAAGSTFSGMTSAILCKLADYTADNTCNTTSGATSWAGGFNDDFITKVAALRPAHIRYLDVNNWINTPSVPGDWNAFPTSSAWSYNLQHDWWAITNWFGSASGTNSYAISCANGQACTYTLTAGAPKDGDFVQFYNVNANTSTTPTLAITDASAVTSAAIPIFGLGGTQTFLNASMVAGSTGTVSLTFNTTPVGAGTCLAGGTHTTSAYTILITDTGGNISTGLYNIVNADATLKAQNLAMFTRNPNGGSGTSGNFQIYYANNACALTITANLTGAPPLAITSGPISVGGITANTLYTATYNALLGGFVLNGSNGNGMGSAWPYLTQLQLAQAVSTKSGVKIGCWLEVPLLWSTASFTSLVNLANANQCPNGTKFEYSNEVWNFFAASQTVVQAISLGASVGLGNDPAGSNAAYYTLRTRQLWGIASSTFGGIAGNLHTVSAWQAGGGVGTNLLNGTTLCGTSCGNQAYQNVIGTDYTVGSGNGTPKSVTRHLSQAPYYHGAILNSSYGSSGSYGTWSATSSSVASNVLNVAGTVTGTIWWNQGISGCDGAFINAPTASSPIGAQLTGTVTTTLNGALASDNTHTWTLTSTAGLQTGMYIYNQTTGMINGIIGSINGGANQITNTGKAYRSAGANDTIVFGGKAGTYQLNSTSCAIASTTITGGDVLGLQYAADNYCTASTLCSTGNAGIGSVQDAYNWIYQDLLVAAQNNNMDVSGQSAPSMQSVVNLYNQINAVAVANSLDVEDYEGGYDATPPTTGSATSMGLPSAGYGYTNSTFTDGYIGLMLTAFKNNVGFKNAVTANHNQELLNLPAGSMGQWYVFDSNARWALFPAAGLYATPFQSYNGICTYNGNPC